MRALAHEGAVVIVAWWRGLTRRLRLAVAGGGLAVLALVVILVAVLGGRPGPGPQYLSFTGCLLTDARGISGPQAAAAWAGLRDASSATRMQAQFLPVPATARDARPYLTSLLVQRCGLVVAVGRGEASAVAAEAGRFSSVRFIVVGGSAAGANVTVLTGPLSSVRARVAAAARSALARSG